MGRTEFGLTSSSARVLDASCPSRCIGVLQTAFMQFKVGEDRPARYTSAKY